MPHVSIKHFPSSISAQKQSQLVETIALAVCRAFDCDEGAISISMKEVSPEKWHAEVYGPDIEGQVASLVKAPSYQPEDGRPLGQRQ